MGCCGQKRAALRTRGRAAGSAEPTVTPPRPPEPEIAPDRASNVIEYLGDQAVLVGVSGGRLYTFSPGRRSRSIPAQDAEQLLRNPLFRQDERRSNGTRQEGS
ncbi:MAG: hypothetical protein ACM3QU_03635 [Verrucomicrobiota bacterium]